MNKQKNIVACIAFVLVVSTALGQAIKTSSKNIIEPMHVDGYRYDLNCKETYSYYIDSLGNYVRHGEYSCVGSQSFKEDYDRTGNLNISYSYKATYKNGKLNGCETSTTTIKGSMYKRFVGTANYNTTGTSTTNYKDGKLNGIYKYTFTTDGKTEKIASVNYVDDKMADGDFQFIDKGYNLNIKGKIDEDGYYSYISIDNNRWEYKFLHGYVQSIIARDQNMQTIKNETYNLPDIITSTYSKDLTDSVLLEKGYMPEHDIILSSLYEANQLYNKIVRLLPSETVSSFNSIPDKSYGKLKPIKLMTNEEFESLTQWLKENLKSKWSNKYNDAYEYMLAESKRVNPIYTLVERIFSSLPKDGPQMGYYRKDDFFKLIVGGNGNDDVFVLSNNQQKIIFEVVDQVSKEYEQEVIEKSIQTIKNALDEIIKWPSKDKSSIEAFYRNGKGKENNLFEGSCNYTYSLLKDWLPIHSYTIDSVMANYEERNCLLLCYINVGKPNDSYETFKTSIFININTEYRIYYKIDESKSFKLKEKIYNDWDSINALQDNIRNNNTKINKYEKTYKDVWDEYNTHKTINSAVWATIKEDEVKQYLALYNSIIDTQMNYILFISSRKAIDSISPKILASATDYKDIQKAYGSYYKACNFKISNIKQDCQRMNQILDIQDSCLSFIELRKNIDSNNQKLATYSKTAKNIYGTYTSYFKGADLAWTADNTCTAKLRNVIDVQNQFLKVMSSPNISDIDKQIKKMKDKSFENIKKQIFD